MRIKWPWARQKPERVLRWVPGTQCEVLVRTDNGRILGHVERKPHMLAQECVAVHYAIGSLGPFVDQQSAMRALERFVGNKP